MNIPTFSIASMAPSSDKVTNLSVRNPGMRTVNMANLTNLVGQPQQAMKNPRYGYIGNCPFADLQDTVNNTCVKNPCGPDEVFDFNNNGCWPESSICQQGTVWSKGSGGCVPSMVVADSLCKAVESGLRTCLVNLKAGLPGSPECNIFVDRARECPGLADALVKEVGLDNPPPPSPCQANEFFGKAEEGPFKGHDVCCNASGVCYSPTGWTPCKATEFYGRAETGPYKGTNVCCDSAGSCYDPAASGGKSLVGNDKTTTYLLYGAGALAILGIAYFAMKKGK